MINRLKEILTWFDKNIFVRTFLTILAVVSSLFVFFTYEGLDRPDLTYYIVKTNEVYSSKSFKGDLSTATIQIWNRGKVITKDKILEAISIRTTNSEIIYQPTITNSRPEIGLNWWRPTNEEFGVIRLDWKVLEQNDAVKIQFVYGGKAELPIFIEGVIEGQKQGLTKFSSHSHYSGYEVVLATSQTCFWGAFLFTASLWASLRGINLIYRLIGYSLVAYSFFMCCWCVVYFYRYFTPTDKPPFGF